MDKPQTILIVEDVEMNRRLLARYVEDLGYLARTAEGGAEALEMLDGVDLVLTDALMPGMDGFALVRHIRRHRSHVDLPIIMVTSLNSRQDRLDAVEAGANDFIAKPVSSVELRVRCVSLLRMKQALDEIKHYQDFLEALVEGRHAELAQIVTQLGPAQPRARKVLERLRQGAEIPREN